jgi:SsrA-binding protein
MKIICKNRRANFEYSILEKIEAGLVLQGSELKPIREGRVNIADAFVDVIKGDLYLLNSHISEYDKAKNFGHTPLRPRKLLMHRKQINKLIGALRTKGQTIIPLSMYFNKHNFVKVEIALAIGKKLHDKRVDIKEREWNRQKQALVREK